MPKSRVVTLPALSLHFGDMVEEIIRQCGRATSQVTYKPEAALEAAFGSLPPFFTENADKAGFTHDGNLANLVSNVLATLQK